MMIQKDAATMAQLDQMRAAQMQATGSDPGLQARRPSEAELEQAKAQMAAEAQRAQAAAMAGKGPQLGGQQESMQEELQRMQSAGAPPQEIEKAKQMMAQRAANPGDGFNPQKLTMGQMDQQRAAQAQAQGNQFGQMQAQAAQQAAMARKQAEMAQVAQPGVKPAPAAAGIVQAPAPLPNTPARPAPQGMPGPVNWRAPKPRRFANAPGGMMQMPKPPGMQ